MRSKKLKKAFTLVELVVVIAVIAVLAGVSVGAYFGITETANKSAAQQHVRQLNDMLTISYYLNGGSNKTFHEARIDTAQMGLDVCDLQEYGSYKYAWDSENDKFTIVDLSKTTENGPAITIYQEEKEVPNKASLFLIAKDYDTIQKYPGFSYYLHDDYDVGEYNIMTVKAGIDTGYVKPYGISYESTVDQKVIFRTGHFYTELYLDGENTEFIHYGYSSKIDIKNHKKESKDNTYYSEYGVVAKILVQQEKSITLKGASSVIYVDSDENYVENYSQIETNIIKSDSLNCTNHKYRIFNDIKDVYFICTTCGAIVNESGKEITENVNLKINNEESEETTRVSVKYSVGYMLEEEDYNNCAHKHSTVTAPHFEGDKVYTEIPCDQNCGFKYIAYNACNHIWELGPVKVDVEIDGIIVEHEIIGYRCTKENCAAYSVDPVAQVTQYRLDLFYADEIKEADKEAYEAQKGMFSDLQNYLDATMWGDGALGAAVIDHDLYLGVAYRFKSIDTDSNTSYRYENGDPSNPESVGYKNYFADFVVSFDRERDTDYIYQDGEFYSLLKGSAGLWGYYQTYTVGLGFHSPMDIKKGQQLPLLMGVLQTPFTYEFVVSEVSEFDCGAFNCSADNLGLTLNVTLGMWDPTSNVEAIINGLVPPQQPIGSWSYTFNTIDTPNCPANPPKPVDTSK